METVEFLKNLSLLSFALSGVFGAAAVFLFFKLNIRAAVRILTGRAMKKGIQGYRSKGYRKNSFEIKKKTTESVDTDDRTELLEKETMLLGDKTLNP